MCIRDSNHTHHEQRAGGERDAQGVWNSKAAAAYPPDLNWTLAGAFNALVDDPSARHERRFRQFATPTNLPASAGAIGPPRPLPRTPPQLPPPTPRLPRGYPEATPSFLPSQAPDEPWDVGATAEPQPAPAKATPSSVEDTPDMQTQPSALPDLPSSRTRSKTAEIASMGAALIATGLNDVSSDAIVILSGRRANSKQAHPPTMGLQDQARRLQESAPRSGRVRPTPRSRLRSDALLYPCLLYTSPSPRDLSTSRMPSSA